MENSSVLNSDTYINVPKLLFQLFRGKVALQRLPDSYLQKLLSTSYKNFQINDNSDEDKKTCNILEDINNYEEDKENESNFCLSQDQRDVDGEINKIDEYRVIKRKKGGAAKEFMLACCKTCNKIIAEIDCKRIHRCKDCSKICVFKCGNCNWLYKSLSSLKTHLYKTCNPLVEYQCTKCDYTCFRLVSMEIHVSTHRTPVDAENTEAEYPSALLQCDLCPFTANFKNSLLIHLRAKHPEMVAEPPQEREKIQECLKCGRTFMNKSGLKEHAVFCENMPKIKCKHCIHKFHRPSLLKLHMKRAHENLVNGENNDKCQKKEDTEENNHPKKVQNDDDLPYIIDRIKINSDIMVKRFCNGCKKTYIKPKRQSRCVECGAEIYYACTKCNTTFPNYGRLKNHVRFVCFGKTLYYCKECNSSRSTKEFMLKHIRKVHGKVRI